MIESLFIALAIAMDCFAISVVCGVLVRRIEGKTMLRLAFLFGFFQAMMPFVGWFLTNRFSAYIQAIDHWIAFGMLAFIGAKMISDSFKEEEQTGLRPRDLKAQLLLAVATSIDALAVGITYACTGYERPDQLIQPLLIIGLVSFFMSLIGFTIGVKFGSAVNKKMRPELLGGIILLGIGIKILADHLSA